MIALPTKGFARSIKSHNCDLIVAGDWLDLVAITSGGEWSQADVSDVLVEGDIYNDQSFAAEFVQSMFAEIRRRKLLMKPAYPLETSSSGQLRLSSVVAFPTGLLFCLLLVLGTRYSDWATQFGGDYREQGELFELLMVSAVKFWFPAWEVMRTGWGDGSRMALKDFVKFVADRAREEVDKGWEQFVLPEGKDLGLDVIAVRPFPDEEGGLPVMMWQCASGRDWTTKLRTPDTKTWHRVMTTTHTPLRALGTPEVIPLEEMKPRRNQSHGLVLDRYRLLPPVSESEWLDRETAARIQTWCAARIEWLRQTHPLN